MTVPMKLRELAVAGVAAAAGGVGGVDAGVAEVVGGGVARLRSSALTM